MNSTLAALPAFINAWSSSVSSADGSALSL